MSFTFHILTLSQHKTSMIQYYGKIINFKSACGLFYNIAYIMLIPGYIRIHLRNNKGKCPKKAIHEKLFVALANKLCLQLVFTKGKCVYLGSSGL